VAIKKTVKSGIKSWSEQDRPREKLSSKGPKALSDAELLAILINTGTKEKSALDLAKELLKSTDNDLNKLGSLSLAQIKKIKGIKEAKAITIAAALELGRRRKSGVSNEKIKISTSRDAYEYLYPLMADLPQETFIIILLNRSLHILKHAEISRGSNTGTVVDVKEIFKIVSEERASSFIVAHNHPSGNRMPSENDISLTDKIGNAAKFFDTKLIDHIIFAGDSYFSFADEGKLKT